MTHTHKRVRWLCLMLAACAVMLFLLWVGRAFQPLSTEKRVERNSMQYMLREFELLGEGMEGESLYHTGEEVAFTYNGNIWSFFDYVDGAAFVPSHSATVGFSYGKTFQQYMYAVDSVPGAESVELELRLGKQYYEDDGTAHYREWSFCPECLSYENGFAVFAQEAEQRNDEWYLDLYELGYTAMDGDPSNGISYWATLRYYGAGGELLRECVIEMDMEKG